MTPPCDLDQLLDTWAHRLRLTPTEAEDIRRRIVATPAPTSANRTVATSSLRSDAPTGIDVQTGVDMTMVASAWTPLPVTWWQSFARHVADVVVQTRQQPSLAGNPPLLVSSSR